MKNKQNNKSKKIEEDAAKNTERIEKEAFTEKDKKLIFQQASSIRFSTCKFQQYK